MFRRLPDLAVRKAVSFTFDGRSMQGREGDSIAAALLANGIDHVRVHPVSGAPRSPYCLMGVCFECLVTVNGVGNRQACQTELRDAMVIESQRGARAVSDEISQ
ncbi:(2Fe-2S)-binding protein [Telmatospirillum sp.]|uniref:(2Fe-2S)-binding protein n=1 Tax=Telmatospirillum sp. TaxID=2079197 RepID=UPI0028445955|nr:(2Fe-2S)-binding protein [Telmatospirillum sp.]MDR3435386.1 (2Fe-2S)-binding protein [Telmatospirillum sp.]